MRYIKLLLFIPFISITFLSSCHNKSKTDHKALAAATKMNGIYVFIKSTPATPYEVLGSLDTKWYDRLLKLDEQSILSIIGNIKNTVGFNGNLVTTIEEVEQKYPTADGIIFDDTMSNCDVIKFKD